MVKISKEEEKSLNNSKMRLIQTLEQISESLHTYMCIANSTESLENAIAKLTNSILDIVTTLEKCEVDGKTL